jgi:hypothetical protein
MAMRHILEMVNKQRIDKRPANRADCRKSLCRGFFGNLDAESVRNLKDKPDKRRRPFFSDSFPRNIFSG